MKKQFTLVLVALFICNMSVSAQELPQITSISAAGRGVWNNTGFGAMPDFAAQVSDGVFVWIGKLTYAGTGNEGQNQSFKFYVNQRENEPVDKYQLLALTADEGPEGLKYATVEDGGTYDVVYVDKETEAYTDNKWRIKNGEDGYYKITFNVLDPTSITMSLASVDETYANLGSLSMEGEGLTLYAVRGGGDEIEGFDPDVYEYNCYIPENDTYAGVTYFGYRNTTVAFNGSPTENSYTYLIDVSDGDISTVTVTGFDKTSTKTYTINYKIGTSAGFNKNDVNKISYFVDGQALKVAGVDAYVVYSVNGTVVADIKSNVPGMTVSLLPGVYIVKANTAETFKVVIK
ncbi:MAG: cadherin-like beta sandwich domain-containing protein [Tannerellaceae bacterium]|jgi:hypothetical protein|nr:cadherin-like beta sandwich domain-containing protein [Tannerellaceae bacterium]